MQYHVIIVSLIESFVVSRPIDVIRVGISILVLCALYILIVLK